MRKQKGFLASAVANLVTIAVTFTAVSTLAQNALAEAPKSDSKVKILGNEKAPQGGTFLYNLGVEPTTLNPITGTDAYNQTVQGYVLDSLMNRNFETYGWDPALAEKVEISKDGREFTFTLRQGVQWSDGKPLTIEDVKFSFDVIFDDKYNAAQLRPYYENIEKAEVTGPNTIKFVTKSKYFGNFDVVAGLTVLPKHIYGNADEGKKKNKTILGSGPYVLKEYQQGQAIILERNKTWWGNSVPEQRGRYNFQTIRMRFDKEENLVLERLKKGELHFDTLTPEAYMTKTEGAPWGKEVLKKKVENLQSKSYGYIGWNMTREMFADKKVRRALAHMMNRAEMNKKFRFGMSLPATGPWYQQSEYADPATKAIAFDPKKAIALFKDAGWTDSNKDGVLDKGGKRFEFSLFFANKDTQKYWVMYQEDLKKVGVVMNLQLLEWNALLKNLDERKFDAVALGWGGGSVDLDPKQIWHTDSMKDGGSNRVGYSNKEVDKLIEEGAAELDKKKRVKIYRKVYAMIAEDAPYAFLFNDKFILYAVNKQIGLPKDTYKFAVGTDYWWMTDVK
ncbi:extracellular solute-binding protein [soil metagenome]